jgi:alpha/beta superfamily hydrolase
MMIKADGLGSAVRVDEGTGIRESAAFFGSHRDKLFGVRSVPVGEPRGVVVVCSALHADFSTNYRKEVLAARALAGCGLVVQRFHYRGVGNSDGEARDVTFGSLSDDVRDARAAAHSGLSDLPTAYLATRVGALPAAAVAREDRHAPMVLWEPTLSGDAYAREALRALRVKAAKDDRDGMEPVRAERIDLEERELVDVLGYGLYASFVGSIRGRTLGHELGTDPRALMVVQLGSTLNVRKPLAGFAETCRSNGSKVSLQPIIGEEPWWFTSAGWVPVERRQTTRQLIEVTAGWMVSTVGIEP